MQYNEEYSRTTLDLPKSLLIRAKHCCLDAKMTLKDVLTKLLIKWVAEQEKKGGKER